MLSHWQQLITVVFNQMFKYLCMSISTSFFTCFWSFPNSSCSELLLSASFNDPVALFCLILWLNTDDLSSYSRMISNLDFPDSYKLTIYYLNSWLYVILCFLSLSVVILPISIILAILDFFTILKRSTSIYESLK